MTLDAAEQPPAIQRGYGLRGQLASSRCKQDGPLDTGREHAIGEGVAGVHTDLLIP